MKQSKILIILGNEPKYKVLDDQRGLKKRNLKLRLFSINKNKEIPIFGP
jgi:hypothetical protein